MTTKYHTLLGITSLLLLSACSSTSSMAHLYNNSFGLTSNLEAEASLQAEEEFLYNNVEETTLTDDDPRENGTFFAEDWVKPKDVITYKYPGDPHVYTENELPKNKARLGNVIIKVPQNMSKEEVISQLNSGQISY